MNSDMERALFDGARLSSFIEGLRELGVDPEQLRRAAKDRAVMRQIAKICQTAVTPNPKEGRAAA